MRTTLLVSLVVASACAPEPDTSVAVSYGGFRCPVTICGSNSHELPRNGMWEANLFGEVDQNKMSLETSGEYSRHSKRHRAQIWDAQGTAWDLHVEKGRLFGRNPLRGDLLQGENLVGSEVHVLQSGSPIYNIRIDGVRKVATAVGEPDPIEVYTMVWVPQNSLVEGELCEVPKQPFDNIKDQDQLLGMMSDETLVFEGDRIDANALTMNRNEGWDPSWFNFGCAGRTIAKLRLLRKTQGNGTGVWASRQAALKMLAADYCGNGRSFTRTGTRIAWKDDEGLVDFVRPPTDIEARWNEEGATCVSRPRLDDQVFHLWDLIREVCVPRSCWETDLDTPSVDDLAGQKIVTAFY
ncbi:MAG: hypothetical protein H0T46_02165 [Deltaproteobacteria bacterium]|nr:hypothetical protein [Deltaproteobacteria bacterium]